MYVYKKYPRVPIHSSNPLKLFLDQFHAITSRGMPRNSVTTSCPDACDAPETESFLYNPLPFSMIVCP
jgi:hypothetical protein